MTLVLTEAQLLAAGACSPSVRRAIRMYPDGVPVTQEALTRLERNGIGVFFAAGLFMTLEECKTFIRITLLQRHSSLVGLFRHIRLFDHAEAIRRIEWDRGDDAYTILWVASRAAFALRDAEVSGQAAFEAAYVAEWTARDVVTIDWPDGSAHVVANAVTTASGTALATISWLAQALDRGTLPASTARAEQIAWIVACAEARASIA